MATVSIPQALALGIQFHRVGQLAKAEHLYRQVIALQPDQADALHYLGVLAHQMGRREIGVELIRRSLASKPRYAEAWSNLGKALGDMGRADDSIAACREAIALDPTASDAHFHLGNALRSKGDLDSAVAAYRNSIGDHHAFPQARCNLGVTLTELGRLDEAISVLGKAIELSPACADAYYNLGNAFNDLRRSDEALAAYTRAIALKPDLPEAHNNVGGVMRCKGKPVEAVAAFRRAIALRPDYAEAHHNLALMLLLQGDFAMGWEEYEWRLRVKNFASTRWSEGQSQWDGSDPKGKTILLHPEQGYGDTMQFARYAALVAGRGAKVIIACPPELHRLLQSVPDVVPWLMGGDLPRFDFYLPLLSLARVFRTTLDSIPVTVPYLRPDPADVERWRERLASDRSALRVGLAWAGRPTHTNDHQRSVSLSTFSPLAGMPGVIFYSLQMGQAADQAKHLDGEMRVTDFTKDLRDFSDTAALIENLDLVISVDTAVVHLAGAIGKPVWTMLPFAPDWRWLLEREDSPWYPTMRLFRQQRSGDWDGVVLQVATALRSLPTRIRLGADDH